MAQTCVVIQECPARVKPSEAGLHLINTKLTSSQIVFDKRFRAYCLQD